MQTNLLTFDPDKVAYYEKAGWEAYYDRRWLRTFWLLVQLNRETFAMPWWTAVTAALDSVRAAIAFAPAEGNDIPRARQHLQRFFAKARRSLGLSTEAQKLAELEMDYWIVHRQLAQQRQQNPQEDDIEPMIQSLTNLHTALFAGTPMAMRRSAEFRALAAKTVDRITGHTSTDVAGDWQKIEAYLQEAYRTIKVDRQATTVVRT